MKINVEKDRIDVLLSKAVIDDGECFKDSPVSPNYAVSSNTYKELEPKKVHLEIPYNVFKEIVRIWDITFNDFTDGNIKNLVEEVTSTASIVEPLNLKVLKKEQTAAEEKLYQTYKKISQENLVFDFEFNKLLQTDYMFIIEPLSSYKVNTILITMDQYHAAKDKDKAFYLAIRIPFSLVDTYVTDNKSSQKEVAKIEKDLPVAKIDLPQEDASVLFKVSDIIERLTYESGDYVETINTYKKVCNFANNSTEMNSLISKAFFTQAVIQIDKVKVLASYTSFITRVTKQTSYIYGDLFFPVPFYLNAVSGLVFNECSDSEERNLNGFFSEAALGLEIEKDAPLYKDFNAFYLYDVELSHASQMQPVKKDLLPWPDFD